MKIYTAHPISGLTYDEVMEYYNDVCGKLFNWGYTVLCPMIAKTGLKNTLGKGTIHSVGYPILPVSTNQAILDRDHWMVSQADIVYIDLTGATKPSIGCCMELAFAYHMQKHIVLAMEEDNINKHAFTLAAAGTIFTKSEDAMDYLRILGVDVNS